MRERKKRQTRAALSKAALELVGAHGLEAVTVDDICRVVDVSPRTFFNYFGGKEDALTDGGEPVVQRLCQHVRDAPPEQGALTALRHGLRAEAERFEHDRDQWLLRMRVIKQNPSLLVRIITNGAADEQSLVNAVAERTGTNPDRDLHPLLVASTAGAAFRAALRRWCEQDGRRSLVEQLDEAFDLLSAGLPDPLPSRVATR